MLKIHHMTNIPLITAEDPGIPVKYTVKVINKEYGKQNQASAKNYYIVYVHILVRARAITCFQSEAIPPCPHILNSFPVPIFRYLALGSRYRTIFLKRGRPNA